jgi:hypothetical protein
MNYVAKKSSEDVDYFSLFILTLDGIAYKIKVPHDSSGKIISQTQIASGCSSIAAVSMISTIDSERYSILHC